MSQITQQAVKDGMLLFLPLPPSTNARMGVVRVGGFCKSILTKEARQYIENIGTQLKILVKINKFQAIDEYRFLDLWFILPRSNCDSHNYQKVLFDTLEAGGVVTDDRYLLPRIMGVYWDAKRPEAIVKI